MDLSPLIEKMRARHGEVERAMADPGVFANRQHYEELAREHRRLATLVGTADELADKRRQLADNLEMLEVEDDAEFRREIEADNAKLEEAVSRLDRRVLALVLPPRENDSRNTIVEIRPAAGGDEAGLFAGLLLRMYCRFAESRGWKVEVLEMANNALGGIKEAAFSLTGEDVYRYMQFESGVHRVQRVPVTEASGRIHTSTVTVAVLPEAKEVDIHINPEDIQLDVFRSSGPGGQSVNTTDSAVRLTHLPSGLSVASQQEKSQHRNREIAMRLLRARLLEMKQREEAEKYAAERRSQVGSGDRSERIRTYNFPQNRLTDHRFGVTWYNLPAVMEGDLDEIIESILAEDSARRLAAELEKAG